MGVELDIPSPGEAESASEADNVRPGMQRLASQAAAILRADVVVVAYSPDDARALVPTPRRRFVLAACGLSSPEVDALDAELATVPRLDVPSCLASWHSAVLPLTIRNARAGSGALYLARRDGPFSSREIALAEMIAKFASLAVVNASVAAEASERRKELAALNEIATEVLSLRRIDEVLSTVCRRAADLLGGEAAYLALASETERELTVWHTQTTANPSWAGPRLRVGEGVVGLVALHRKAMALDDYEAFSRENAPDVDEFSELEGLRSLVAAPMLVGGRLQGVLLVASEKTGRFHSSHVPLLQSLADQAAIALETARLYDRERRELEIHDRLTSLVLLDRGYAKIVRELHRIFGNPVALFDASLDQLGAYPAGCEARFPPIRELIDGVLRHSGQGRVVVAASSRGMPTAAAVAPVVTGQDVLGYIAVLEGARPLTRDDVMVAERAAVVLALRVMRERLEAEVEQAFRGELIDDLLANDPRIVERAAERAGNMGHQLTSQGLVMIVEVDTPTQSRTAGSRRMETAERFLADAATALGAQGFEVLASRRLRKAIVVVAGLADHGDRGRLVRSLQNVLGGGSGSSGERKVLRVGVGKMSPILSLRDSFDTALACLKVLPGKGEQSCMIADYEDLAFGTVLLEPGNRQRVVDLVTMYLGALTAYDRTHQTNLVGTLRGYLDASCSKTRAARDLHIGVSTLKYRLTRIVDIAGVNLRDPETCKNLTLALTAQRLGLGPRIGTAVVATDDAGRAVLPIDFVDE